MSTDVQPIAEAACSHDVAPSGDSGTSGADTVRCTTCGWQGAPGPNHCPECGCWVPLSAGRLTHGAKRLASGRGTPLDHARIAEIQSAVVADLGGEDSVSEVMLRLVADFSFACTLRDLLSAHLAAVGPLTKAGKRRAALTSWQQVSARVEALARQIGTDRRSRPVPSLHDYLRQRQADADNGGVDDD